MWRWNITHQEKSGQNVSFCNMFPCSYKVTSFSICVSAHTQQFFSRIININLYFIQLPSCFSSVNSLISCKLDIKTCSQHHQKFCLFRTKVFWFLKGHCHGVTCAESQQTLSDGVLINKLFFSLHISTNCSG